MALFDVIAFDADDTLWHNERIYADVQARLAQLLSSYQTAEVVRERLLNTETNNVKSFGYGIKSFTLSMIETAIELSEGKVSATEIKSILNLGKGMLQADVELLKHTRDTITRLAASHHLMVITKGDLQDQQMKMRRSGLAEYFQYVEVVSDKNREVYEKLLQKYALEPGQFMMVGDSLRSDILPILDLGAQAVYIPYQITWQHEAAEMPPDGTKGFFHINHLGQLPDLLKTLEEK